MATKFKMTEEQTQALRDRIYTRHNVKHGFQILEEYDERREFKCSNHKSSKCSGEKATWLRANKIYCETCKNRCDKERRKIIANRAEPQFQAALKEATTQAKFDKIMKEVTA